VENETGCQSRAASCRGTPSGSPGWRMSFSPATATARCRTASPSTQGGWGRVESGPVFSCQPSSPSAQGGWGRKQMPQRPGKQSLVTEVSAIHPEGVVPFPAFGHPCDGTTSPGWKIVGCGCPGVQTLSLIHNSRAMPRCGAAAQSRVGRGCARVQTPAARATPTLNPGMKRKWYSFSLRVSRIRATHPQGECPESGLVGDKTRTTFRSSPISG